MPNLGWAFISGAAGGTPGGSDEQVQYNEGGSFGGSEKFTFDYNNDKLELTGTLKVTELVTAMGFGNATNIASSTTVPTSHNFVLWGPITIDPGIGFVIDAGANVKIKDISDV
jgi:hypothetical protein